MQQVFAMLTADEHVALMQRAGLVYYEPDTAIIREGEASDAIYIIRSGQVRVETESSGFPLELSRLGPGHIFGEISFIDGAPVSASVITERVVAAYRISRRVIESLFRENPGLYGRFFHSLAITLAQRVRNVSDLATDREPDPRPIQMQATQRAYRTFADEVDRLIKRTPR